MQEWMSAVETEVAKCGGLQLHNKAHLQQTPLLEKT